MENTTKHFNALAKRAGQYKHPLRHVPAESIPSDNQQRYELSLSLKTEYNRQEIIRNSRKARQPQIRYCKAQSKWFKIKCVRRDQAESEKIQKHNNYIDALIKKYKPRRTTGVRNKELTGTLMECLASIARRDGWKQTHRSNFSIYLEKDDYKIRISDHYLPFHPEREYNHNQGWKCANSEIIVTDQKIEELIELLDKGGDNI